MKNKDLEKLTARQRKELQQKQKSKANKKGNGKVDKQQVEMAIDNNLNTSTDNPIGNTTTIKVKHKYNKKLIIVAGVVAVVLITLIIYWIPILFRPRFNTDNPVARMQLSNGMTIDYEIFANNAPRASGVFIYLAQQGFFDNTIIIDLQRGFVRFGGYTGYRNIHHRENDERYVNRIRNRQLNFSNSIPEMWTSRPFSYRVLPDTGDITNRFRQQFYLSYIRSTATEFQISGFGEQHPIVDSRIPSTVSAEDLSSGQHSSIAFGRTFDRQSEQNIYALANMEMVTPTTDNHLFWRPPVDRVYIRSVRIHNLNGQFRHYRNFNIFRAFYDDSTHWLGLDINTHEWSGWSNASRLLRDL